MGKGDLFREVIRGVLIEGFHCIVYTMYMYVHLFSVYVLL